MKNITDVIANILGVIILNIFLVVVSIIVFIGCAWIWIEEKVYSEFIDKDNDD